jgi:hypothetical protein
MLLTFLTDIFTGITFLQPPTFERIFLMGFTHRSVLRAVVLLCAVLTAQIGHASSFAFNLLPVELCDTGPGGGCYTPNLDKAQLEASYADIGVALTVLDTISRAFAFNFTNGEIDPFETLPDFRVSGIFPGVHTVILGFTPRMIGPTVGLAYLLEGPNYSGIQPFQFGIIEAEGRSQAFQTAVTSHEIGHLLGATHDDSVPRTLMNSTVQSNNLSTEFSTASAQVMLNSPILEPIAAIPLPASASFMLVAMVALFAARRRRTFAQGA